MSPDRQDVDEGFVAFLPGATLEAAKEGEVMGVKMQVARRTVSRVSKG